MINNIPDYLESLGFEFNDKNCPALIARFYNIKEKEQLFVFYTQPGHSLKITVSKDFYILTLIDFQKVDTLDDFKHLFCNNNYISKFNFALPNIQ